MKDKNGLEVPQPKGDELRLIKEPKEKLGVGEKLERVLELLGDDAFTKIQDEANSKIKGKLKPFKLPGRIAKQAKKGLKKGKILVFFVKANRGIDMITTQLQSGMYFIDGAWRNADPKYLYYLTIGKMLYPCYLQPQRTNNPVSLDDGVIDVGNSADAQRTIVNMLETGDVVGAAKSKMKGGAWIWIGLGVVIVLAIIFGGGV